MQSKTSRRFSLKPGVGAGHHFNLKSGVGEGDQPGVGVGHSA